MSLFQKSSKRGPENSFGAPCHIAIVMDGNGRWAEARGLSRSEGHIAGSEKVHALCEWAIDAGVRYLTVYAFSTENWKRPKTEVQLLFKLLGRFFRKYQQELLQNGIHIRFLGRQTDLPQSVRTLMAEMEAQRPAEERLELLIAFNYGGRAEIVDALRAIVASGVETLDEETVRAHLYAPDVPDPDLLIRPGGEQRLSNFLLWETAYSEFVFTPVLWPDFSRADFDAALEQFRKRQRRFGGLQQEEE